MYEFGEGNSNCNHTLQKQVDILDENSLENLLIDRELIVQGVLIG